MEKYILKSFINKYGIETFDYIVQTIKNEIQTNNYPINVTDDYILYIFEIAIFSLCGISQKKISDIISKMGNPYLPEIDPIQLQKIHNDSINLIKKHLNSLLN